MFASIDWRDVGLFVGIAAVGYGVVTVFYRVRRGNGASSEPRAVCPNPECRQVNMLNARFCSRCGAELTE